MLASQESYHMRDPDSLPSLDAPQGSQDSDIAPDLFAPLQAKATFVTLFG